MLSSPCPSTSTLPCQEVADEIQRFQTSLLSTLDDQDSQRVELLCELPVFSSQNFDDLSFCQDLRKRALATLHLVCDDLRSRGLDPKYRLLPSVIPFSSIRVLDLEENAIGGVELSGKIDARGPARRNSDALMEELEGLKLWQDRLHPHTFVLPASKTSYGPTLVMT